MSGPEIDRRCPDCGAAVRAQAAFCPQCGRIMKAGAVAASEPPPVPSSSPLTEGAETQKAVRDGKEADNSTKPLTVGASPNRMNEPSAASAPTAAAAPPAPPKTEAVSLPAQKAREVVASNKPSEAAGERGARARGQRVAAAARDVVEERLAPRVEKLRQASNVVWDEAQDDPNLRFILIAVLLFIIAGVIILLGTYLR